MLTIYSAALLRAQKFSPRFFLVIALFSLFNFSATGQVIFQETFDEADGSATGTDNTGGVMWTSACPACVAGDHYEVQGGVLEGQDTNGPATWETGLIDITSCGQIEISFTISSQGSMEACGTGCNSVDWVQLEYNIDGSGWQTPANSTFCAGPCADINVVQSDDVFGGTISYTTGCMVGGGTLQLRIAVQAWAGDEFWRIDDVLVECGQSPFIDGGADVFVCDGNSVTLTATNPGGAVISWDNGITDGVAFTPSMGTTTYTVTATSGFCSNTDEVDVTVTSAVIFGVSVVDATSCLGGGDGSIVITGLNPSTTYSVSYNDGAVQGPADMNSDGSGTITITGLPPGVYTDFLVDLAGCSGLDQQFLTIDGPPDPFVDAGAAQSVCEGDAVILEATNPDGAVLSWDNGVTDGTPFTPAVGTLDYTVTATDAISGCFSTDITSVSVTDVPVVSVTPAGPFLISGGTQMMSASPAGGTWSAECGSCIDPVTGEFDPLAAGPGSWDVCYEAGTAPCEVEECIVVTVTDACILGGSITSSNPTCFGLSDGSVTINVTNDTPPTVIVITNSSGTIENPGGSNTANTLAEGWYYFNISDNAGCSYLDSVEITDPGQMTIDLVITDPDCYGVNSGSAIVDTVYNYTGAYNQVSYFWNPNPTGINGLGENDLLGLGEGSYNLVINDQNGCAESFDFQITYPDSLYFSSIGFAPAHCRVYSYQSGNGVVYAAASGGSSAPTYTWENLQTGATTNTSTWGGLNPGNYQISVTDNNGCVITEVITVDSLSPVADFTLSSPGFSAEWEGNAVVNVHFVNQSINFADSLDPLADTTFFWNFGFDPDMWVLSEDVDETFDVSYTEGGIYDVCLVALNKNGCTDTMCVPITIYDPLQFETVNVFTPDADGINDVFTFNDRASSVETFACTIVDRWGIVLFEMTAITDGWNGTDSKGNLCPDGVYFYFYNYESFNGITGSGQGTVQLVHGGK